MLLTLALGYMHKALGNKWEFRNKPSFCYIWNFKSIIHLTVQRYFNEAISAIFFSMILALRKIEIWVLHHTFKESFPKQV